MEDLLESCKRLMEFSPQDEVDEYSEKQLRKKVYGWHNDEKKYLARTEYFINGRSYTSILKGFYQEPVLDKIKINFIKPDLKGRWAFTKPPKEILEKDGKGVYRYFDYDPTRLNGWSLTNKLLNEMVMVRAYMTDFFVPISINTKSKYHHAEDIPRQYTPELKTLSDIWADVRKGVIPFGIRICCYSKVDRISVHLDPLSDSLLPHPICCAPYHRRNKNNPIDYVVIDTLLARLDMPWLCKRILEFVFECGETTAPDVSHVFNIQTNIAENNLRSLGNKELVKKRKESYYYVDMEELRKLVDTPGPQSPG